MRSLRPPPKVMIPDTGRQYPPSHLFEPVASRQGEFKESAPIASAPYDFDNDVQEQMRLLEESVRAMMPSVDIDVPSTSAPYQSGMPKNTYPTKQRNASDVNLKDWKINGYPSEYAYAKDLGLLDMKPNVQKNVRDAPPPQQILQHQVDDKRFQREWELQEGRASHSVGNYRDAGPSRNESLAQHMQGSQGMPLKSQYSNHLEGPPSSRREAPRFNTGLAVGMDLDSEKALKKQKQAEYRQQLDSENNKLLQRESQPQHQQQQQPSRQLPRENYSNPSYGSPPYQSPVGSQSSYQPTNNQRNGRLTPKGMKEKDNDYPPFISSGADKNDRRQRQEDYKRELDRQMHEKAANAQKEKDVDNKIAAMHSMASANDGRQSSRNGGRQRQEQYQQPSQSYNERTEGRHDSRSQIDSRYEKDTYQHDYENDPQYQEYVRRMSKNNPPMMSDRSVPLNNAYNGSQRGEPQRSQASYAEPSPRQSPYGGSNPLLGGDRKPQSNNAISQKSALDAQLSDLNERKLREKLRKKQEADEIARQIQAENAEKEEQKRLEREKKQQMAALAHKEMLAMQERVMNETLVRKGKAPKSNSNSSAPVIQSQSNVGTNASLNEGQRNSHQENTDDGYTQSRYREEHSNGRHYPAEEDFHQGPSYSSARDDPRGAAHRRVEQEPKIPYNNGAEQSNGYDNIDYDNDPNFQAFLRRQLEEENYNRGNREVDTSNVRNNRAAEKQPYDERDNRSYQESPAVPSQKSPKQPSRAKMFSEVYGYGNNPLLGGGDAPKSIVKPAAVDPKQKYDNKAALDAQLQEVKERKRLEQEKIKAEEDKLDLRIKNEIAAEEERKRAEKEKNRKFALDAQREVMETQARLEREALARKGKHNRGNATEEPNRSNEPERNDRSESVRNVNNGPRNPPPPPPVKNNSSYDSNGNTADSIIDESKYPNVPLNSTDDSLRYSNTYNHLPPKPQPGNGHYSPRNEYMPPRHNNMQGSRDSQEYQRDHRNEYRRDNRYGNERNSQDDDYRQSNSNYGGYNNPNNNNSGHYQRNQQSQYQQQQQQQQQQQYERQYHQPYQNQEQYLRMRDEEPRQDYYDDNDTSFVSESRLLPVNPWSSSDMLSKLIPLGSSVESNTRTNRSIHDSNQPQKNHGGKNELEQSLASNSLLLYLGSRTPLVESTVDKPNYPSSSSQKLSIDTDRERSASTPKLRGPASRSGSATSNNAVGSDERLQKLIDDTNRVIEREKNSSSSVNNHQGYRKDSMKDIINQHNGSNSVQGDIDTKSSRRTSGDNNSGANLSVMQRTALNSIRNDLDNNSSSRASSSGQQDRQSQQSNSARGNYTPRGGQAVSSKQWDTSADSKKVVMLRLLSAGKSSEPYSPHQTAPTTIGTSSTVARMQLSINSNGDATEEDYMNDSFSSVS